MDKQRSQRPERNMKMGNVGGLRLFEQSLKPVREQATGNPVQKKSPRTCEPRLYSESSAKNYKFEVRQTSSGVSERRCLPTSDCDTDFRNDGKNDFRMLCESGGNISVTINDDTDSRSVDISPCQSDSVKISHNVGHRISSEDSKDTSSRLNHTDSFVSTDSGISTGISRRGSFTKSKETFRNYSRQTSCPTASVTQNSSTFSPNGHRENIHRTEATVPQKRYNRTSNRSSTLQSPSIISDRATTSRVYQRNSSAESSKACESEISLFQTSYDDNEIWGSVSQNLSPPNPKEFNKKSNKTEASKSYSYDDGASKYHRSLSLQFSTSVNSPDIAVTPDVRTSSAVTSDVNVISSNNSQRTYVKHKNEASLLQNDGMWSDIPQSSSAPSSASVVTPHVNQRTPFGRVNSCNSAISPDAEQRTSCIKPHEKCKSEDLLPQKSHDNRICSDISQNSPAPYSKDNKCFNAIVATTSENSWSGNCQNSTLPESDNDKFNSNRDISSHYSHYDKTKSKDLLPQKSLDNGFDIPQNSSAPYAKDKCFNGVVATMSENSRYGNCQSSTLPQSDKDKFNSGGDISSHQTNNKATIPSSVKDLSKMKVAEPPSIFDDDGTWPDVDQAMLHEKQMKMELSGSQDTCETFHQFSSNDNLIAPDLHNPVENGRSAYFVQNTKQNGKSVKGQEYTNHATSDTQLNLLSASHDSGISSCGTDAVLIDKVLNSGRTDYQGNVNYKPAYNDKQQNTSILDSEVSDDGGIYDFGKSTAKQIKAITELLSEIETEQEKACLDQKDVQQVITDINDVLNEYMQGCHAKLYGSYHSGFAIGSSDVNVELFTAESVSNRFMNNLSKLIQQDKPDYYVSCNTAQNIMKTKVICSEPKNGTTCEIKYLGEKSVVYRTSKLLNKISEQDKRIKTLVVALRYWAEVCHIHDATNGRLHPLALVLMAVHFLQRTTPPVLPVIDTSKTIEKLDDNSQPVGELWLELLKYYSNTFNWRDQVVSILSLDTVLKETKSWAKCWIGVESPFDERLNVAKSVVSQDVSQYIQMCFMQTYKYFSLPIAGCDTSNSCNTGHDGSSAENGREYNYTFFEANFTEGMDIPTFCVTCADLGFTCEDCAEENKEVLEPLPKMTQAFLDTINKALEQSYEAHALQPDEISERRALVSRIEKHIQQRFRDVKLELMGSSVNGFGFRNSDLDISLVFKGQLLHQIDTKRKLRELCLHLRKSGQYISVFALYSAKIPLIQFVHRDSGLRGDISLYNLLALHNTKLLYTYSVIDKRAKILGCAMKLLAKNGVINDTAQKSLSSYSYILMVIHFLQRTTPPILPVLQELANVHDIQRNIVEDCDVSFFSDLTKLGDVWQKPENNSSVGELWVDMLKYYTEIFDLQNVITIRQSSVLRKDQGLKSARLFNIEDPFITYKNLGSVMSDQMSMKTMRTLLRARKLFGVPPIEQVLCGLKNFEEYFFDPMKLTDGRVMKAIECDLCGKLGHKKDVCGRFNFNFGRGRGTVNRGRGRFFASRGHYSKNRGYYNNTSSYGRFNNVQHSY